jgi:hypothetical protein
VDNEGRYHNLVLIIRHREPTYINLRS